MSDENKIIGLKRDVAEKYNVAERTVEHWMEWLPHYKIGRRCVRFNMDAVDRAITERFGRNGEAQ